MLDEKQSEEIAGELVLFAEEADRFNGSLGDTPAFCSG
jgi:hypothetical protein